MSSISPIIQNSLSLLEENLNSTFAGQLSDFLSDRNIIIPPVSKPVFDMIETESFVTLYVSVPGVTSDKIDVDFFNNCVNIKGERVIPDVGEPIIKRKREITYGKFDRKVTIPISVTKKDSVRIFLENGILTIQIDKTIESSNKFTMRPSSSI